MQSISKCIVPITLLLTSLLTVPVKSMEIFEAIKENQIGYVKQLIDINSHSIKFVDSSGYTPLYYAVYYYADLEIIRALIATGADLNAKPRPGSYTPFSMALDNKILDEKHQRFTQLGMNDDCDSIGRKDAIRTAKRAYNKSQKSSAIYTLLEAYNKLINTASRRACRATFTIACATHRRLGSHSPLASLQHSLLIYIAQLNAKAEDRDARGRIC